MANPNISAALTPAQKNTLKTNVNNNKAIISPFGVNLTPAERKKIPKTGPNSVSYVQLALKTAQENPTIIPGDFDIAEFGKDVVLFADLEEIRTHHSSYVEMLDDTKLAVGSEAVKQANRLYEQVKIAAKNNSNMDAIRQQLAQRFKGQGKKKTPPTP